MSKLYVFEGGAPDKLLDNFPIDNKTVLVDSFISGDCFIDLCNKVKDTDDYVLVCSEHQLVELIDNPQLYDNKNVIMLRCSDVESTKKCIKKSNVLMMDSSKYRYGNVIKVNDSESVSDCINSINIGNGVIVKPLGNSGGRGILAFTNNNAPYDRWGYYTDINRFIDDVLSKFSNQLVLIQGLTNPDASHYAISAVIKDGKVVDFHSIVALSGCKSSPKWYNFGVDYTKSALSWIEPLLDDIVLSLDIKSGIFEVEVCNEGDRIAIIEINPRYSWTTSMSRKMFYGYSPLYTLVPELGTNDEYMKDHFDGMFIPMKIQETVKPVANFKFYENK